MKQYELLTVLPGTLTETELEPELEKVKDILKDLGAENLDVRDLGKTKMSYQMDGIKYGYYFLFNYNLEPSNNDQLQEELNKISSLLRAMIEQVDPEQKEKRREINEIKSIKNRDEILEWIDEKEEYFEKKQEDVDETKTDSSQKEEAEEDEATEEDEDVDKRTETEEDEDVSIEEIDDKLDDILDDDEDLSDV
ncbi:MAG: 30S ribosomal protein S6 [Candidatus Magasanikbacteria bacterium]